MRRWCTHLKMRPKAIAVLVLLTFQIGVFAETEKTKKWVSTFREIHDLHINGPSSESNPCFAAQISLAERLKCMDDNYRSGQAVGMIKAVMIGMKHDPNKKNQLLLKEHFGDDCFKAGAMIYRFIIDHPEFRDSFDADTGPELLVLVAFKDYFAKLK